MAAYDVVHDFTQGDHESHITHDHSHTLESKMLDVIMLWHYRLGNLAPRSMLELPHTFLDADDMRHVTSEQVERVVRPCCDSCRQARMGRCPH